MPNWVDNRLIATGPAIEVNSLIRLVIGDRCFDFNKIIPMPQELRGTTSPVPKGQEAEAARLQAQYGHANWYSWACANWGTKWGACNPTGTSGVSPLEELAAASEDSPPRAQAEWGFQTAWSPPEPVMKKLSEMFPEVTFTWDCIEEQPSFGGSMTLVAGEVVEGGYCEGEMNEIWSMSDWHENYRYDPDEDE